MTSDLLRRRHPDRFRRAADQGPRAPEFGPGDPSVDLDLGTRRASAAALLTMALPGSVYV